MDRTNITVLLPAGRLPLEVMNAASELAEKHGLTVYLTNEQNLRLLEIPEDRAEEIRQKFWSLGMGLKSPGIFPLPRVCVGQGNCKLGWVDPALIARRLVERCSSAQEFKPKVKIGVSACVFSCSGATIKDIGIVATKNGFNLYVGGKGGVHPQPGRRVLKAEQEEGVLRAVKEIVDFHQANTSKKQRMAKLIDDPDFPYPREV